MIQVENWQFFVFVAGQVVMLITAAWTLGKVIVGQFSLRLDERQEAQDKLRTVREQTLDTRFTSLENSIKQEGDGWRTVERDLLHLKADLPIQYTRREDTIRQEVVIHAKLDALASKIDALRAGV
jgi:hypothetical protein